MSFNPDYPVYIGFGGRAGAGKTLTAKRIVPRSTTGAYGDINSNSTDIWGNIKPDGFPDIHWDHLWLSLPLYDMYEIRTQTKGDDSESRILYQISEIVNNMMMKKISYEDMIELVYDIYSFPIDSNEEKPRNFLQGVGDLCRKADNNCFANYMRWKIENNWRELKREYDHEDVDPPLYIVIISDVRMPWEAEMIVKQPNHMLFRFDATDNTLKNRLLDRDGQLLSSVQAVHDTENSLNDIPEDWFDNIFETDGLSLDEQAQLVYNEIATSVITFKEEAA